MSRTGCPCICIRSVRPLMSASPRTCAGGVADELASKLNAYISANCFAEPAVFSADDPNALGFGNSGVGIFEGPGQDNVDLSLSKRFALHRPRENSLLEFRAEFFNAFNHPQFCDPDVELNSPTFGQISCTSVAPRIVQFGVKFSF